MHNNLRITRILKSLGELGFEHYQAPLVRFFLEETLVKKNLSSVKRSVLDYFLFAVRDKRERRKLIRYAFQHFEPKDKFVWCPRKIQKRFKKKAEKRQDSSVGNGQAAASEEPRPQSKMKDPERDGKIVEIQKQSDDDPMSVDFEKQLESSELIHDSFSVDPLPLNNGSSVDGEMDQSSSAESSTAKIQDADEVDIEKDSHPETPEIEPHEPEQDSTKTKNENIGVETNNCSPELSSLQDESENTMLLIDIQPGKTEGANTVTCLEKAVVESPKHALPSASLGERAEKLPMTSADGALVSDQTEVSGDSAAVRLLDNKGTTDTNNVNKQTNGTEKGEPMDTEASVGCQD